MNNEVNNNQVNNTNQVNDVNQINDASINNVPLQPNYQANTNINNQYDGQIQSNISQQSNVSMQSNIQGQQVYNSNMQVPQSGGMQQPINTQFETQVNANNPTVEKGSTFRTVLIVILFIALFGYVFFLPDIQKKIDEYKASKNKPVEVEISSGVMTCEFKDSDSDFDYEYTSKFTFVDYQLTKLVYTKSTITSAGSKSVEFDSLDKKCNNVEDSVEGLTGVFVSCGYSDSKTRFEEDYTFEYDSINTADLKNRIVEAGGTYPEFVKGQDIKEIEREMNSTGYTCRKSS